jgi:hypothetical protein
MTTQNTAVHPSRAVKLCANCQHHLAHNYCNHPSLPINVSNGMPTVSCKTARGIPSERQLLRATFVACALEDEGFNSCGIDAILFAVPLPRPIRTKVMVDGVRTWVKVPQEGATSEANHPLPLSPSGLPQ